MPASIKKQARTPNLEAAKPPRALPPAPVSEYKMESIVTAKCNLFLGTILGRRLFLAGS